MYGPLCAGRERYNTAAFTIDAASGFRPEYGLDKGFQRMEITQAPRNTPDGRRQKNDVAVREEGDGASGYPIAKWLKESDTDRPVFIMHHNRTAHFPFVISPDKIQDDATGMTELLWNVGTEQHAEDTYARLTDRCHNPHTFLRMTTETTGT